MKKAFFINGGAGRVLCSIPALEHYAEKEEDFVIVSESWAELYLLSPILRGKVFPVAHTNLFNEHLKDKEIISPEPYRLNAYFNQNCNLIQAFDIIINDLGEVPETKKLKLDVPKKAQVTGYNIVNEVKSVSKKEKVVIFQPFGQGTERDGNFIIDSSGRSFELSNVYKIIEELTKEYGVILMTNIEVPNWQSYGVASPSNVPLIEWAGIINAADYFIGCDSIGQHFANALNKPATVVIGSTYPENISYPLNKDFTILDLGKEKRKYSPIRMTHEPALDLNNESLMVIDNDDTIKKIKSSVVKKIGKGKKTTAVSDFQSHFSGIPEEKMPVTIKHMDSPPLHTPGKPGGSSIIGFDKKFDSKSKIK